MKYNLERLNALNRKKKIGLKLDWEIVGKPKFF